MVGAICSKISYFTVDTWSNKVFYRLVQEKEYSSTFAEIEVALKMKLAGFSVSFVQPNSSSPSPDLQVADDSISFNIEVSSINPPDEHERMNEFFSRISTISFERKVSTGGIISRTPKQAEILPFIDKFHKEIDKVVQFNEMRKVTEPGLITLYVAQRELERLMPEDCRGGFRMIPLEPRPDKQRILAKIHEKIKQVCVNNAPGMIVLYSEITPDLAVALFEEPLDDISATIATYPKLIAFVLTCPQRWFNVDETPLKRADGNRILLRLTPAIHESETMVIWTNSHGEVLLPEKFLQAFKNYPRNLSHLDNIPLNFL